MNRSLLIAISSMSLNVTLWAQAPGERPADRAPGRSAETAPPRPDDPATPAKVRVEIERRLEETKRVQLRLERALAQLDAGADPAGIVDDPTMRTRGRRPRDSDAPPAANDQPRRDDSRSAPPVKLTDDERDRAISLLEEKLPRVAERLRSIREREPAMFDRMLNRMRPKLGEIEQARAYDPALFELRVAELGTSLAVMDAIRGLREAKVAETPDQSAIDGASKTLREAVSQHFDSQTAIQEHESTSLAGRLDQIKSELDQRRRDRDARINDEFSRIVEAPPTNPSRRRERPNDPNRSDGVTPEPPKSK